MSWNYTNLNFREEFDNIPYYYSAELCSHHVCNDAHTQSTDKLIKTFPFFVCPFVETAWTCSAPPSLSSSYSSSRRDIRRGDTELYRYKGFEIVILTQSYKLLLIQLIQLILWFYSFSFSLSVSLSFFSRFSFRSEHFFSENCWLISGFGFLFVMGLDAGVICLFVCGVW